MNIETSYEAQQKSQRIVMPLGKIACVSCPMRQLCEVQGGSEAPICENTPNSSSNSEPRSYESALEDPSIPIVTAHSFSSIGPTSGVSKGIITTHKQQPSRPVRTSRPPQKPTVKPAPLPSKEKVQRRNNQTGSALARFVSDLLQLRAA